MNRRVLRAVWVIAFSVAVQHSAGAGVPQLIAYQGRLTDADGTSLIGDHTVRFRLYDAESGGSTVWEEEHRVTLATQDNGVFSIMLGSLKAFGTLQFNQPLWLSLEVDGEGEMAPRLRLTAVGYAINADTLDGLKTSQLLRADVDTQAQGQLKLTRSGFGLLIQPAADPSMTTNLLEVRRAGGSAVMTLDLAGTLKVAGVDFGSDANDDLLASDVAILTGGPTSNADTLHTHTLNAGTGAGQLVQLDSQGALPAVSGANLTNLNASNVTSGTLDAARLPSDGYAATYVNVTGDTMSGTLTLPANGLTVGTNQLVVSGGNVGIGTTSPARKLDVNGAIKIADEGSKPACDATTRGTIWMDFGGADVKDTVEVCAKKKKDTYAWMTLIGGEDD